MNVGGASALAEAAGFATLLWGIAVRAARARGVTLRGHVARPVALSVAATVCAGAVTRLPLAIVAALCAGSCVCAATDWEVGLIFDDVTAATLGVTVGIAGAYGLGAHAAAGALADAGCLAVIRTLTRGLGWGDVKLGACIGAALGPRSALLSLGLAFVLGGVAGSALLLSRRVRPGSRMPFGPFLAAGCFAAGIAPCSR